MATRNVVLPDPMEQDINELVETGRYQNRSEVIRAGLRLLLQQEAQNSAKLEALRNATSSGLRAWRYSGLPVAATGAGLPG